MLKEIFGLFFGLVCLVYMAYCLKKGGTHSRYEGWVTKKERPKTFWVCMVLYGVLGVASFLNLLFVYIL